MYAKEDDEEELSAFGFLPSDFAPMVVEVWPENWKAFELFSYMQTQWCVGANGATGLNYLVLYQKLDRMNLSKEESDQLEEDVRVMEFAALAEMHKKS